MSSICLPPGRELPAGERLLDDLDARVLLERLHEARVAVRVGRDAGDAAHLDDVALAARAVLNSHSAPSRPYATWSFVDVVRLRCCDALVDGDDLDAAGGGLLRSPRSARSALDGLMMIALAPAEIRLRMSAICSAGPPLRFATMTLLTLPLARACALTEQIISSRQPLPTSVLETPITYFACGLLGVADARDGGDDRDRGERRKRDRADRAHDLPNRSFTPPWGARFCAGAAR